MNDGWDEPETAWWAKHGHAKDHLERLRGVCAEYRSTNPLEVRAESTDVPGETAYRLHQAICSCGWRGADRDDELPADGDRWQHVKGCDQAPDGSWISRL